MKTNLNDLFLGMLIGFVGTLLLMWSMGEFEQNLPCYSTESAEEIQARQDWQNNQEENCTPDPMGYGCY